MNSKLPPDWRKRRDIGPRTARFTVERAAEGYDLVDWAYGTVLGFERRYEAVEMRRFAKAYVKRWGDIDLESAPYTLDDELNYDDPARIDRFWQHDYPPRTLERSRP